VWSCGVILYVLLVGRLPFDDEHIPSLFAKIAKGTYSIPSWMPAGAVNLIKKMLVVNPVQRATIDDIRQDPWFMTDLPLYLQPPVEEFFNTGMDPSKAIEKSDIAPHASEIVQERLHNEVTEKISKTMGYGKGDVEEALQAEEPSAIKDAYLIVRENKLMQVSRKSTLPIYPDVAQTLILFARESRRLDHGRARRVRLKPSHEPVISTVWHVPDSRSIQAIRQQGWHSAQQHTYIPQGLHREAQRRPSRGWRRLTKPGRRAFTSTDGR
jgi:serine/threonine protein kinase